MRSKPNHRFFCDYTVWTIRNSPEFGVTSEEREMLLRRGGMEIYTTLDLDIQEVAWDAVMTNLPPDNEWGFGTASVSLRLAPAGLSQWLRTAPLTRAKTRPLAPPASTTTPIAIMAAPRASSRDRPIRSSLWPSGWSRVSSLGDHVDGRVYTGEDIDR